MIGIYRNRKVKNNMLGSDNISTVTAFKNFKILNQIFFHLLLVPHLFTPFYKTFEFALVLKMEANKQNMECRKHPHSKPRFGDSPSLYC